MRVQPNADLEVSEPVFATDLSITSAVYYTQSLLYYLTRTATSSVGLQCSKVYTTLEVERKLIITSYN